MGELPINQIVCGDNCDVLGTFPRDCIDLVVTSPPYDDLRTYGGHDWDFYGVAWQLKRVLKPGGVIVWVVNDKTEKGSKTGNSWMQAHHFRDIGLNIHDTMIYQTDKPPMNDNRYQACFEYMFIFSKGKPSVFNPIMRASSQAGKIRTSATYRQVNGSLKEQWRGGKVACETIRESIWFFGAGNGKGTKESYVFQHPATFPEALARDHILSWSNEGDIVLDPFSGSGTTAKMAKHNGRKYIGIEINSEYCDIAHKRLEQDVLF